MKKMCIFLWKKLFWIVYIYRMKITENKNSDRRQHKSIKRIAQVLLSSFPPRFVLHFPIEKALIRNGNGKTAFRMETVNKQNG